MLRYGSIFALTLSTVITTLVGSVSAAAAVQHAKSPAGTSANAPIARVKIPMRTAGDPTPLPTLGRPQAQKAPSVELTLNTLRRDSTGLVTLVWTVRNTGSEDFDLVDHFRDTSYARVSTYISGITLVDETAKLRYNSLHIVPRDTCTCTDTPAAPNPVRSGEWETLYNTFKLPPSVSTVTVDIPGWTAMKNVRIS